MLKYQKLSKTLERKNFSLNFSLAKSAPSIANAHNLSKVSDPLVAKPNIIVSKGLYNDLCGISSRETIIQKNGDICGVFKIGPLEIGQGVTLGSTLRRAILGTLSGSAVTGFKVNDALHEFSVIHNIKEDMLDIAANLKALRINCGAINCSILGQIWVTGPQIITGGMLEFPKETAKVLNPNQYICTITAGTSRLDVEVSNAASFAKVLGRKKGASFSGTNSQRKRVTANKCSSEVESREPKLLNVEANFSPIRAVSYKVKLAHDIYGALSEIVEFTITTNGTYSPRRAILEGAKEIMELFYPLILEPNLKQTAADKGKS